MRLNYHILWFEDNLTAYNIKKEFVREIISEFGFNYIEPRREVNGRNIDTINFDQYDVIIADMNLANGDTGMSLMTKIRDEKTYLQKSYFILQMAKKLFVLNLLSIELMEHIALVVRMMTLRTKPKKLYELSLRKFRT